MIEAISCPFVYANGRKCTGHIVCVEIYKADVQWSAAADGTWRVGWSPRSHYHLFCSEKGNHAGHSRADDDRMKFYLSDLPEQLRAAMRDAKGE